MNNLAERPSLISIIIYEALFLFSGFFTTLAQQFLYYQGAATGMSLLTNAAMYIGMASVGLLLLPELLNKSGLFHKISDYETEESEMATLAVENYQLLSGTDADDEILTDTESFLMRDDDNINTDSPKEKIDYKTILLSSVMDFVANFALTIGFFYIGSGMYQVIYSSVVIWCAVLSFFFLGRKLSLVQSICIIGVSIGLALSALGINHNKELTTPPPPSSSTGTTMPHSYHMSNTMFGMLLTSFATFGYAFVYVISDQILSKRTASTIPPSPRKACFLAGTYSTILSLTYITFYTIPNWDTLITQEMEKKVPHSSTFVIILIYILLILSSFIHNIAYYWLIKELGNVSTGLLNSLRAIVVFGLSHFMFCQIDHGQCFNIWKGWSAVTVIGFVTIFSFSKAQESK